MKPLLISSGEPAGVGPDLCLALAYQPYPVVVMADKQMLAERAKQLRMQITLRDYEPHGSPATATGELTVCSLPCLEPVIAGKLNHHNSSYVLHVLREAGERCLTGEFSGLVTAPVQKSIINDAGFEFTGHTEFFAALYGVSRVVMMLACPKFKVALATTHLPLRAVADAITPLLLEEVIRILHAGLRDDFGLAHPKIHVAGLNPHAGESGYLGMEEIDIIAPTLHALNQEGIDVAGPFSADTLFTDAHFSASDAFLTMYHDQGLPVLKYAGFGDAVNITLGLPVIRTSVDHGTALTLAGTGRAKSSSLIAAVEMAMHMASKRMVKKHASY